ncbi:hypothetical protein [Bordetella bronchialis]|uniref:Pertussis toxin subunit 1 n=1 Tax=Bordetella bronchialis TaxID=463025 RepID=A0A193FH85_9BORD|nr:hypothetical protein [Bordetella bronchialis]ANN66561.1 hypothetical protein BAU06_09865 [Bordetella bronchialis]ANN71639.1 hypothetical protein BAU08_10065 [Bordetella bronchialis]
MRSLALRIAMAVQSVFLAYGLGTPAAAAPEIVYRVDARAPTEIFANGFRPWGDNDDVLAHVAGKTTAIGSRSSAFVATTEDMNQALRFLNFFSSANQGSTYWLYRIYTDDSFYSTNVTLESIYKTPPRYRNYDDAVVTAARTLYATFQVQKEWLAKGGIASNLIIDAASYQWDGSTNEIKPAGARTNGNASKPASPATDQAYDFTPQEIATYSYIKQSSCNVITDDFCPAHDERKIRAAGSTCLGQPMDQSRYATPRSCGMVWLNVLMHPWVIFMTVFPESWSAWPL